MIAEKTIQQLRKVIDEDIRYVTQGVGSNHALNIIQTLKKYNKRNLGFTHAKKLLEKGCKILDIGGESTRPGSNTVKKEIEWKNKDHALFVGYMPINKPKYAISVVVEHGGSGSSTAAPIARKIFDEVHNQGV